MQAHGQTERGMKGASVVVLSVIGFALAAAVWENVHPLLGVLTGILFVGGLGWVALGAALVSLTSPGLRGFLREWQRRVKPIETRADGVQARSLYATWRKAYRGLTPGPVPEPRDARSRGRR